MGEAFPLRLFASIASRLCLTVTGDGDKACGVVVVVFINIFVVIGGLIC